MIAAKPPKNIASPPPIILVRTEGGNVLPVIKWNGYESYSWHERLEGRIFGRLKRAALQEALRIVNVNGSLSEAGEYGSLEIDNSEFEVDSNLQ